MFLCFFLEFRKKTQPVGRWEVSNWEENKLNRIVYSAGNFFLNKIKGPSDNRITVI